MNTLVFTTSETVAGTIVPVEVSTNGVDFDSTFLDFMFAAPVAVTSVTPNVSTSDRLSVVVHGHDFIRTQLLKCSFGPGIESDAVFVSTTSVQCMQPSNLNGEFCIAVSLNAFQFSSSCAYVRIVPAPSIFSVAPSFASPRGASVVFLNGSGFVSNSSSFCRFNSILTPSTVYSDASCSCVVPPGLMGMVRLDFSVNGLDYANSEIFIAILEEAIVFSVSPSSGPMDGGTFVTVTGINFVTSNAACRFGGAVVPAVEFTSTSYICKSPASEPSTVDVDVSTGNQVYTQNSIKFNYLVVPSISSLHPSAVPTASSSFVTVYGSSFVPSQMICRIEGFLPFRVSFFVSSTTLIFETPMMPPGVYSLVVSYNGADFSSAIPILVLDSVDAVGCHPSMASVRGGTAVSIVGNNFSNSSRLMCVFGDVMVSSSWMNSTVILCKIPENTLPGTVSISLYFPGGHRQSTGLTFLFHGKSAVFFRKCDLNLVL
jgi:hypothetical protein